jgi:hypothetical protein
MDNAYRPDFRGLAMKQALEEHRCAGMPAWMAIVKPPGFTEWWYLRDWNLMPAWLLRELRRAQAVTYCVCCDVDFSPPSSHDDSIVRQETREWFAGLILKERA